MSKNEEAVERTPREWVEAWVNAPEAVKLYVLITLQQQSLELDRAAARGTLAAAMVASQMATSMGDMEKSFLGNKADGKLTVAMAAMGASIAASQPPEEVLSSYIQVAYEVLDMIGTGAIQIQFNEGT